MTVWVVTNCATYPEAMVVAVFSDESIARAFADKRNADDFPAYPAFHVHEMIVDQWEP